MLMAIGPKRSGGRRDQAKSTAALPGYTDVVDADLSKYFDTIPHSDLMLRSHGVSSTGMILRLIKMWLKAPVEERDGDGTRRMTGGKASKLGTPQGGVISPVAGQPVHEPLSEALAHARRQTQAYRAHIVSYADDFVILSRGHAAEALAWTRGSDDAGSGSPSTRRRPR